MAPVLLQTVRDPGFFFSAEYYHERPLLAGYTSSMNEGEWLPSANSAHSRYKGDPACAGFLNGDFRPIPVIGLIA